YVFGACGPVAGEVDRLQWPYRSDAPVRAEIEVEPVAFSQPQDAIDPWKYRDGAGLDHVCRRKAPQHHAIGIVFAAPHERRAQAVAGGHRYEMGRVEDPRRHQCASMGRSRPCSRAKSWAIW